MKLKHTLATFALLGLSTWHTHAFEARVLVLERCPVNNSAKQMVGTFNELTGAGAGLSSLIVDLSNAFDELSLLMASGALSEFGDIFVQQILVTRTAFDNFSEDTGVTLEKTKMSAEAWSHEITKFLSDLTSLSFLEPTTWLPFKVTPSASNVIFCPG